MRTRLASDRVAIDFLTVGAARVDLVPQPTVSLKSKNQATNLPGWIRADTAEP